MNRRAARVFSEVGASLPEAPSAFTLGQTKPNRAHSQGLKFGIKILVLSLGTDTLWILVTRSKSLVKSFFFGFSPIPISSNDALTSLTRRRGGTVSLPNPRHRVGEAVVRRLPSKVKLTRRHSSSLPTEAAQRRDSPQSP